MQHLHDVQFLLKKIKLINLKVSRPQLSMKYNFFLKIACFQINKQQNKDKSPFYQCLLPETYTVNNSLYLIN